MISPTKSSLATVPSPKEIKRKAVEDLLIPAVVQEGDKRVIDISKLNLPAKTINEAVGSDMPNIAIIRSVSGDAKTNALLVKFIKDLADFFSVGKGMKNSQCAETAKMITSQYYYLNLADIKLCFDRIKAQHYGPLYDRFDGGVVMWCLGEYVSERMEVAESLSHDEHSKNKDTDTTEIDSYYVRTYTSKDSTMPSYYIRDAGAGKDELIEVLEVLAATKFSHEEAYKVRNDIAQHGVKCMIEPVKKPDIGLIEYVEDKLPTIKQIGQSKKVDQEKLRRMNVELARIEASDLDPLEKENKRRGLAGLRPVTQGQAKKREKIQAQKTETKLKR